MLAPTPQPTMSSNGTQKMGATGTFNAPHILQGNRGPPPPGFTYATLRPVLRSLEGHGMSDVTFNDFVPPPPPMFESGSSAVQSRPPGSAEKKKNGITKKQESCV